MAEFSFRLSSRSKTSSDTSLLMLIKAGLMERLSLLDPLNLNQNRLNRIRDGDLQPFLPFA